MELQEPLQSTNSPKPSRNFGSPQEDPNLIVAQRKIRFGPSRQAMKCPHCQASMRTRIESCPTYKTHFIAVLLCLTCLWPCVPCVYCSDNCLTHKHYCTNCDKFLGQSGHFSCLRRKRA